MIQLYKLLFNQKIMAVENQNEALDNEKKYKEIQTDISNYLIETFKDIKSNNQKEQIISKINTYLSHNKRNELIDYIKSQALKVKEYENCDDQNQFIFLLKWLEVTEENLSDIRKHIYEFWACVLNNTWPLAKKEMPSYDDTYNPETTHQSRNETPSYENTYHISNRNRAQEFIESNEKAPYHIEITGWTIIQKTLTASFKHWFDNKNVTYNILWSNAHYRWNWFYEIDLFAKWWHIKNEKSILIRYDWWDAFVLWNAVTNEPSWIAKVSWEWYSINGPDISIHWRKVNLEFKQNWATINLSISITPKINTYNNGDY